MRYAKRNSFEYPQKYSVLGFAQETSQNPPLHKNTPSCTKIGSYELEIEPVLAAS
jgi:hypothetical protein